MSNGKNIDKNLTTGQSASDHKNDESKCPFSGGAPLSATITVIVGYTEYKKNNEKDDLRSKINTQRNEVFNLIGSYGEMVNYFTKADFKKHNEFLEDNEQYNNLVSMEVNALTANMRKHADDTNQSLKRLMELRDPGEKE